MKRKSYLILHGKRDSLFDTDNLKNLLLLRLSKHRINCEVDTEQDVQNEKHYKFILKLSIR